MWLPQRTRWFKGWFQTWLVHMRAPLVLGREVGGWSFMLTQILFLGLVVSALVHPIFLATVLYACIAAAVGGGLGGELATLLLIDAINISAGYGAFLALGAQTLLKPERDGFWKVVLWTPAYWLLLSLAAWWAMVELYLRPHHWHKTPHLPMRRARA